MSNPCILETIGRDGRYSCFVREYGLWCPFATPAGIKKYSCRSGTGIPAYKSIHLTEKAYDALKQIVENGDPETWPFTPNNISEWILAELDGYNEMHGEPDFEIG